MNIPVSVFFLGLGAMSACFSPALLAVAPWTEPFSDGQSLWHFDESASGRSSNVVNGGARNGLERRCGNRF